MKKAAQADSFVWSSKFKMTRPHEHIDYVVEDNT